jgi:hypothetical protein
MPYVGENQLRLALASSRWSLLLIPRHLVMGLLFILAACEPYTYDAGGNPVSYRGSASAASSRSENCGTPDEPKRCPPYRPPSRKQSLTPLPDYNDRTY